MSRAPLIVLRIYVFYLRVPLIFKRSNQRYHQLRCSFLLFGLHLRRFRRQRFRSNMKKEEIEEGFLPSFISHLQSVIQLAPGLTDSEMVRKLVR